MKLIFRIMLGVLAVFIIAIAFIAIGYKRDYSIVKAPMVEMCSAVEAGMNFSEVDRIAARYEKADVNGGSEGIQLSQVSQDIGMLGEDWICICHVRMENESVSSADDVFCVD